MLQLLDKKKSFNADASLAFLTLASIGQPNQKGSYPLGKSRIVYKALKKNVKDKNTSSIITRMSNVKNAK